MNIGDFFVKLGHILGILSGDDTTTTTGITTVGIGSTKLSTPVIFDRTTVGRLNTEFNSSVSPKFLSTLVSGHTPDTTGEVSKVSNTEEPTVTGITAESEVILTTKHESKTTTENTVTEPGSTATGKTGSVTTGVTGTDATDKTGTATIEDNTSPSTATTGQTGSHPTGTTVTGQTSPTGSETTVSGQTSPTGSETTVSGQTSPTGSVPTVTSRTSPTGSVPTVTSRTSPTGSVPTVTGQTGSEATVTESDTPGSTDAPPTDKPSLSRGAVAGIVIGCLLLIAVITAAVVFFVKNRNMPPEAQRLRV